MKDARRGPKSRAGLMAYPALVPHAKPIATTIRPMIHGARLTPGDVLRRSVMARIRNSRIAVPTIWSRNAVPTLTGSAPLPGRVEKTPWVAMVCPGESEEHPVGGDGVPGVGRVEDVGVDPPDE